MRILDGCCGLGGATRGYVDAGHEVTGVDIAPQPHYLEGSGGREFIHHDIRVVLSQGNWLRDNFDFVHVSPPCQRDSRMSRCRPGLAETYPDLIAPVRELLGASGLPYVIENVVGSPLKNPVMLCMYMFGRRAYRHRLFEAGGGCVLQKPPQMSPYQNFVTDRVGVRECGWVHPVKAARAGHWKPGMFVSVAGHERIGPMREVMEIDWGTREELAEAIPPYFTRWIGEQL